MTSTAPQRRKARKKRAGTPGYTVDGLGKLAIQISKTRDGLGAYVQISSPAAMPVNIVLVAGEIEVDDQR